MKLSKLLKTILFALSLTLIVSASYGQAMLGFTPSKVRERNPDVDWKYDKWGPNEDLLSMSFTSSDGTFVVAYLFSDSNISVYTSVIPLTQGSLQAIIENYNKRYVVIDERHWKFYSPDGIFKCSLEQTEHREFYFLWSL